MISPYKFHDDDNDDDSNAKMCRGFSYCKLDKV
jgi:hypothetical protein